MFSSYHLRTDQTDAETRLVDVLRGQAWLSVPVQGWISLYDAYLDRPDLDEMHRVASETSRRLQAPVLGVFVQTSETLVYVLYDGGAEVDSYVSNPAALRLGPEDGKRYVGHAANLLNYTRSGVAQEALEALLHGGFPPGLGLSAEHVEAVRQQVASKLPPSFGTPENVQRMLQTAAEQMRHIPAPMIEGFMRSMGLPANHPALEQLRANPAEFIQKMASDSDTVKRFSEQISNGFDTKGGPSTVAPQEQAVGLALALGIDPSRMQLSFRAVDGIPEGFRFLHQ